VEERPQDATRAPAPGGTLAGQAPDQAGVLGLGDPALGDLAGHLGVEVMHRDLGAVGDRDTTIVLAPARPSQPSWV
jgi:hypothetical protein